MKILIKITTTVGVSPTLEVDYKHGQLSKITLKKGILPPDYWKAIGHILPPTESDIEAFKQQFVGKVSYQKSEGSNQKSDSLYKQFLDEWFVFYQRFAGMPPRFNVTDGKHLKDLIAYFKSLTNTEEEAFASWKVLLENWHKLDDFHRRNTDLKYINSNINKIIQNAKKGNNRSPQYSDAFKREILEGFRK